MKRSSLWTLLVLALAAGLGACDSAREITAPETTPEAVGPEFAYTIGEAEKVITQGGGFLRLGDHYLFVPRGAVEGPTIFRMETTSEGFGVELTARTMQGASITSFAEDLTLTLSYSDLPRTSASLARIDGYDANGDPILFDITIWDNTAAKRVWGVTDHFSAFIIADL